MSREPSSDQFVLHHGDAVDVLSVAVAAGSVDLVYLDPPYFTQQQWSGPRGGFDDRWTWDAAAVANMQHMYDCAPLAASLIDACSSCRPSLAAYLAAMGRLLLACHTVLSPRGCLLVHVDDTAIHYLRVCLLDTIFGPHRWVRDIIWVRGAHKSTTKGFGRSHETITQYARDLAFYRRCHRFAECDGWINERLGSAASERTQWPTQKPQRLLERLICVASLRSDVVLDPVMGSGTTLAAALAVGRRAIGIDREADALAVVRDRLATPQQVDLFGVAA